VVSFPQVSQPKPRIGLVSLPYALHASPISFFSIFITRKISGEDYRSLSSSLRSFLRSLVTSTPSGPNILLKHPAKNVSWVFFKFSITCHQNRIEIKFINGNNNSTFGFNVVSLSSSQKQRFYPTGYCSYHSLWFLGYTSRILRLRLEANQKTQRCFVMSFPSHGVPSTPTHICALWHVYYCFHSLYTRHSLYQK
jgi:hypothetical protein